MQAQDANHIHPSIEWEKWTIKYIIKTEKFSFIRSEHASSMPPMQTLFCYTWVIALFYQAGFFAIFFSQLSESETIIIYNE